MVKLALLDQVKRSSNVQLLSSVTINKLDFSERDSFIALSNNEIINARLVVGADGANSFIRRISSLPITFWDYDHHSIVATVKTQLPHDKVARQVFTPNGPLAFLPLYEPNLCSIVWSSNIAQSERLMAASRAEFEHWLTAEIDNVLGVCELDSERMSFPLKMRYCRQWLKDRVVLIGDAAHTIHPLAGQGANLGFADAAALAARILALHSADKDFGLAKHLRPFERERKTEVMKMIASMEGFKRLFDGANPVKKLIRDAGLALTNHSGPLKQQLIRHAMGLS